MKKKHLKGNLALNKQSISKLNSELRGGGITNGDFSCITGCNSEYVFCKITEYPDDCGGGGDDDDDQLDPLNSRPFLACVSGWC